MLASFLLTHPRSNICVPLCPSDVRMSNIYPSGSAVLFSLNSCGKFLADFNAKCIEC